jgi:hypothetical protein
MLFGYFTLFVALVISTVAAYYSIVGLTAIFAAAFVPIVIMGTALEIGKVTAAVWLKINWARSNFVYKLYLVPAVIVLMILTSMGIFGFLSKAHSDQNLVSGDIQARLAIIDEKIKISKENIEVNRKALKQLDEAVDQTMSRSTNEQGADKAVSLRRNQQKDRNRLLAEITSEQKLISQLNEEAAPIRAQVRQVEAEVGPIKYIAALLYGDNLNTNLLEQAVRIVIIIIVIVFDPLALVLILAAQQSLRWAKEDRKKAVEDPVAVPTDTLEQEKTSMSEIQEEQPQVEQKPLNKEERRKLLYEQYPYLLSDWVSFSSWAPDIYESNTSQSTTETKQEVKPQVDQPDSVSKVVDKVPETKKRVKAPLPTVPETLNVNRLQADNLESAPIKTSFGTVFPIGAGKGDLFIRVDYLPNKLYKFNGIKWIEVDKTQTDSYTQDEYVQFLISKLKTGEYQLDQLTQQEQDKIAEILQQTNDKT